MSTKAEETWEKQRFKVHTHHARIFVGYETQGANPDMPLGELCEIMNANGFHVHATKLEARHCDKRREDDWFRYHTRGN